MVAPRTGCGLAHQKDTHCPGLAQGSRSRAEDEVVVAVVTCTVHFDGMQMVDILEPATSALDTTASGVASAVWVDSTAVLRSNTPLVVAPSGSDSQKDTVSGEEAGTSTAVLEALEAAVDMD